MGKTIAGVDESGAGLHRSAEGDKLDSMLVVGEPPWHYAYNEEMIRLLAEGTKVTSSEVNTLAGLDWEVIQKPAGFMGDPPHGAGTFRGEFQESEWMFNVRADNGRPVGVVSKGYKVFQNADAPDFMDAMIDSGDVQWETAGSLFGGKRVWWLAKMPEGITIGGQDKVDMFLLIENSHNGSKSITVSVTPVRVVCQNTLAWALSQAQRTVKVRHTRYATEKFAEARRALEIGYKYGQELEMLGERMVQTSFSESDFEKFLDSLLPVPERKVVVGDKGSKVTNLPAITMAKQRRDEVSKIYLSHPTQQEIVGTVWGAVQAFQFYADHITPQKNAETRFARTTGGLNIGAAAFNKAKVLVKA